MMIVSDVVAVGLHMNECACRHILTPFFKPPVSSSSSCESGILADFSLFLTHNNNLAFASTELEEFSFLSGLVCDDPIGCGCCPGVHMNIRSVRPCFALYGRLILTPPFTGCKLRRRKK